MAAQLIAVLKELRPSVTCLVAPYEADAQLAYLSSHALVDVVISEDSDNIPYGTKVRVHVCIYVFMYLSFNSQCSIDLINQKQNKIHYSPLIACLLTNSLAHSNILYSTSPFLTPLILHFYYSTLHSISLPGDRVQAGPLRRMRVPAPARPLHQAGNNLSTLLLLLLLCYPYCFYCY